MVIKRIIRKIRGECDLQELKKRGLKLGKNIYKDATAIIDPSWCWLIEIGNNVTLVPRVHILAHDASTKNKLNYTKIGIVTIEDNVFIGANSIILPNIIIGKNSIIGAGSIVTHNIPENSLAVGNPARVIGKASDYVEKEKKIMNNSNLIFDESFTIQGNISNSKKEKMKELLRKGNIGFVK